MIIHLITGQIRKIFLHKMCYFQEPYSHSRKKTKFEFDFSNYATKYDLKEKKAIDGSKFPKKFDSVNFKADVNKLEKE